MKCIFCEKEIASGRERLIIKKDGTIRSYCSAKCEKNHKIRKPKNVKWVTKTKKEKKA